MDMDLEGPRRGQVPVGISFSECPAVFRVLASRQDHEIFKLALGRGGHPWDSRQVKIEGLGLVTLSPESQYLEAGQAFRTW